MGKKEGRRDFLKYVATAIVCGVVAGVGGWAAGSAAVPPARIETTTVTVPGPTVTRTVTTTVTAIPKPPRTIKFGVVVHVTGAMAPICWPAERLYKTWAEMINERGGLYVKEYKTRLPVEFIVYDDGSDITACVKYYEKLITEDNVDILIGPFLSDFSMATSTVAEKHGVPYIEGPANAREIHSRGYYWLVSTNKIMDYWCEEFFEYLKWENKVKTLACIYTDLTYSISVNRGVLKFAKDAGIDVVYNEKVPVMHKDFTPTISKLKALDPDQIIFITPIATADVVFQKQIFEQGYRPPAIHHNCDGMLWKAFQEPVGALGEYVTGDLFYDDRVFPYDGVWGKGFYIELQKRAGFSDFDYPWAGHVCFFPLEFAASAIEHAGTLDKKAIMEALHDLNIMTINGPALIRSFEDWVGKVQWVTITTTPKPFQRIGTFEERRRECFWPPEIRTIPKRIYPIPWDKIEENVRAGKR